MWRERYSKILKEVATDIWNNFTVDDLYREIKEKGVVVYEQESR